jgi:DNA mismatch repair ATPase MutS
VSDSLADGISYFYAEVRRLKQLLIELEKPSQYQLFFLIDEIYRGTNNRERRIGSQAYIHALSHSKGVGVVSTHDLDLVQLSDLESNVLNYHFREEIQGNRMVYDYRLRPGPCPTTNALKIMEIEGLPVEDREDKIKQE